MAIAYGMCLIVAMLITLYMVQRNYENVNIQHWSIVVLIPIIIGAYYLSTLVNSAEAAYVLYCFIYLDSTVLLAVLMFLVLHTINIEVKPWGKVLAYGAAFAHLLIVLFSFNTPYYYKDISVIQTDYGNAVQMVSGPLKGIHYAYLGCILIAIIIIVVVGFIRKGTYSLIALSINAFFVAAGLIIYALELLLGSDFSLLPFLYILADIAFALDYNHSRAHEISSVISSQQSRTTEKGYLALSMQRRFLGCNEKCIDFVPTLKDQRIDDKLPKNSELKSGIYHFIEAFERGERNTARFNMGDRIWICSLSYFSIRKDGKNQGYLFELRDATEEEKTYEILQSYNETLNAEVKAKTENIRDIQRKILIGMANLIENRDSSTGGHVKRTSDVVKILIDEIINNGHFALNVEQANDIIRSAPMHDLGKISIDSNILCKEGKLTDEEFAIMKSHAAKSGEIVHILLDGVEEKHFVDRCYNLARYHHEKWDGSGYPEGLSGESIPIEARIMAVADVLDALVCKRCYKEPMSFDTASKIILDGMGRMFDPAMEAVFLGCKDKLEEYYR